MTSCAEKALWEGSEVRGCGLAVACQWEPIFWSSFVVWHGLPVKESDEDPEETPCLGI